MNQIDICYQNKNDRIPEAAWNWYAKKGAKRGKCPVKKITICNVPPSDPSKPKTLQIKESEWGTWQKKGATKGACNMKTTKICYKNKSLTVPEEEIKKRYVPVNIEEIRKIENEGGYSCTSRS